MITALDYSTNLVPAPLRPWSALWSGYRPTDITPPELRPAGLATAVAEGWAEPYATPHEVPDWPARQAAALVPFDLDAAGMPLHPGGRTGRTGRDLGKWGENQAADAVIISHGMVLLIQRRDTGQWALPGGMLDAGETPDQALVRETREETGIDVAGLPRTVLTRTVVADRRTTDHARVTTYDGDALRSVAGVLDISIDNTPYQRADATTAQAVVNADGSGTLTFTDLKEGEQGNPTTTKGTISGSYTWTCSD